MKHVFFSFGLIVPMLAFAGDPTGVYCNSDWIIRIINLLITKISF